MKEQDIQRQILDYLAQRDILHGRLNLGSVKVKGARRANPMRGWPDVLGVLPGGLGRMFVIEVKTEKGRLSPEQEIMRQRFEAKGVVYILARSLDDAMEIERRAMWP